MESQREPHLIGYKKKVPPSPHACKTQLVRESCQNCKQIKKEVQRIWGYFRKSYDLRTQHIVYTFATALFYTQRHILQSESVLQFSTPLFLLANCLLQTEQKTCQKYKRGKNVGQKNTDHIYFKLI